MKENASSLITHQQINVGGISVHVALAGDSANQAILFLHGYPENWQEFEGVMNILKDTYYVLAIDLPGIGMSEPIASGDKCSMAGFIKNIIETLHIERIILVGHDIGGMTTYSFIKQFSEKLVKAIIMNTAIPGIEPWEQVKRNPYLWHFALYAVPALPEAVFAGKQRILFDYFYNTLSFHKQAIGEDRRNEYANAYSNAVALKTSFDWYRAFLHDEKSNAKGESVNVPVLYIRGEMESGDMGQYVEGLKKSGLSNLTAKLIPHCGHFAPEEQTEIIAEIIRGFGLTS
ncbi:MULTISPECIES: alpha/beta fold hydrolase [Niastella]|uniref:Alpha/beta hydrolase n=1 Tax=Niastella soli TaxID=2821487 RepID=A0ABS3Z2K4_9BACT|nr:alpha/beta hydrolase [Niastella soli]MBO9204390.1 alpha/beta hydrolase [Niastella soli]